MHNDNMHPRSLGRLHKCDGLVAHRSIICRIIDHRFYEQQTIVPGEPVHQVALHEDLDDKKNDNKGASDSCRRPWTG
jgi:hypothetical protein